jgi:D-glucosaminate-6-phosphate ammonia-lyase
VIIDAALTVPPVENLWQYSDAGADLVVFSGGKAIGGPPASGFVVGRADLIASIALQHQDMDVRIETWGRDSYGEDVVNPPYQGIGRPMKIGKEQIVGLHVALNRYIGRDHDADLQRWRDQVARIRDRVAEHMPHLVMTVEEGRGDPPNYVPQLRLELGSRDNAATLSRQLMHRNPSVYMNEAAIWAGSLIIVPSCVRDEEESLLIDALHRRDLLGLKCVPSEVAPTK